MKVHLQASGLSLGPMGWTSGRVVITSQELHFAGILCPTPSPSGSIMGCKLCHSFFLHPLFIHKTFLLPLRGESWPLFILKYCRCHPFISRIHEQDFRSMFLFLRAWETGQWASDLWNCDKCLYPSRVGSLTSRLQDWLGSEPLLTMPASEPCSWLENLMQGSWWKRAQTPFTEVQKLWSLPVSPQVWLVSVWFWINSKCLKKMEIAELIPPVISAMGTRAISIGSGAGGSVQNPFEGSSFQARLFWCCGLGCGISHLSSLSFFMLHELDLNTFCSSWGV